MTELLLAAVLAGIDSIAVVSFLLQGSPTWALAAFVQALFFTWMVLQ